MKRYEPAIPRKAFAALAVTLTAATIGLMVVAPATHTSHDDVVLAARPAAATPVTITPSRIDVVASREDATRAHPVADAGTRAEPRG